MARRTTTIRRDTIEPVLAAEEILELQRIVRAVPVSDHLIRYALSLVRQTRVRRAGRAATSSRSSSAGGRVRGRCSS